MIFFFKFQTLQNLFHFCCYGFFKIKFLFFSSFFLPFFSFSTFLDLAWIFSSFFDFFLQSKPGLYLLVLDDLRPNLAELDDNPVTHSVSPSTPGGDNLCKYSPQIGCVAGAGAEYCLQSNNNALYCYTPYWRNCNYLTLHLCMYQ